MNRAWDPKEVQVESEWMRELIYGKLTIDEMKHCVSLNSIEMSYGYMGR